MPLFLVLDLYSRYIQNELYFYGDTFKTDTCALKTAQFHCTLFFKTCWTFITFNSLHRVLYF